MNVDKLLNDFVSRAQAALGESFDALVLYGSAVRGEFDEGFSDLNLLLVVTHLDVPLLRHAAPLLAWWASQNQPQPLLMTRQELVTSTEAFPIEMTDLVLSHRVLYGEDPIQDIAVQPLHHRLQLEHEARACLLRLRMKAMPVLKQPKELLLLLENSVPTFLLIARHYLMLQGKAAPHARRELLAAASGLIDSAPFATLLDLREQKISPRSVDPLQLLEDYLTQVQALVRAVDDLVRNS